MQTSFCRPRIYHMGVGNDAHNFLMNLYRENYFGKCLKWLNRMNFEISAEGALENISD